MGGWSIRCKVMGQSKTNLASRRWGQTSKKRCLGGFGENGLLLWCYARDSLALEANVAAWLYSVNVGFESLSQLLHVLRVFLYLYHVLGSISSARRCGILLLKSLQIHNFYTHLPLQCNKFMCRQIRTSFFSLNFFLCLKSSHLVVAGYYYDWWPPFTSANTQTHEPRTYITAAVSAIECGVKKLGQVIQWCLSKRLGLFAPLKSKTNEWEEPRRDLVVVETKLQNAGPESTSWDIAGLEWRDDRRRVHRMLALSMVWVFIIGNEWWVEHGAGGKDKGRHFCSCICECGLGFWW